MSNPSPSTQSTAQQAVALRKRLDAAFARGKQLRTQSNYDYAHEVFAQCVVHDPANLPFIEALLENLRTKFGQDRKKAHRTIGSGVGNLKKIIARQQWREAFKLGIAQLKENPWHIPTLRTLAEACAALRFNETELAYLKQALEANPKDAEVNRHCAQSLTRMGQFNQAIACWHRVETIRSGDKEARQMISRLSDKKLLHAAEPRGQAAQTKTAAAQVPQEIPEEVVVVEETREALELGPRQLLEQAITHNPSDISNYLKLAELLTEDEGWAEAKRVLERCLAACGQVPSVQEQLERVQSLEVEHQLRKQAASEKRRRGPIRIPWLGIALACCGLFLIIQMIPGLSTKLSNFATAHVQVLLFLANALFVAALFGIRAWRQWAAEQPGVETGGQR